MRIRWTETATADLEGIYDYLRENHPKLAVPVCKEIRAAIRSLRRFPRKGKPGRVKGTRELVCGQQIVVYVVEAHAIQVWRILGAARDPEEWVRELKMMVQ